MESQDERYERESSYKEGYERGKSIGEEITCKLIIRNSLYENAITFHTLKMLTGFDFDEIISIDKEVSAARVGERMSISLIKAMIEDEKNIQDIKSVIESHQSIMETYEKYHISYGAMKEEDEKTEMDNVRRHKWNLRAGK